MAVILAAVMVGLTAARDLPASESDPAPVSTGQLAQSDLAVPPPPPPPPLPGQEPATPALETAPAPATAPIPEPVIAPSAEPVTAPALGPTPAPAPSLAPAPTQEPMPLTDRDLVMAIQEALAERGYDPGPADGLMGARTRDAIRRFQSDAGLPADGEPSQALYQAIMAAEPAPASGITAPAAPAPAASPVALEGPATVLDTANLIVAGQVVALAGVIAESAPRFIQGMEAYIAGQGGTVSCLPTAAGRYSCRTPTGYDIAEAAIVNGAARASDDAPAKYREAERKARAGRRGIWQ